MFLLAVSAALAARADEPLPSLVGRVTVVDGGLAVRQADGQWTDSGINLPLASGMSVRTAPQGRAVLRAGAATIALSGATELELAQLDAGAARLVLRQGRIVVEVAPRPGARAPAVAIDIAQGVIGLAQAGDYDIAAGDGHAAARIAVFEGSARFVGRGLDTLIANGSADVLSGGDPVAAKVEGAASDEFATWALLASDDDRSREALRYVSAEMTGHAALDGYGRWETVNGYGPVWFPRSPPEDWAPYRDGHWRWLRPWGWTWIDNMPWGFATSHYGRWARVAGADPGTGRWGWVPGRRVEHPVFAPALVGFLGTAGVGLSYPDGSGPAVAWFPLAPDEIYWPGYTNDIAAIRSINDGSVDDVATIGSTENGAPPTDVVNGEYANRRFASVVPRGTFTGGRPVLPALLRLPEMRLVNAPFLAGSPQLAPPAPRVAVAASAPSAVVARVTVRASPRMTRATPAVAHAVAGRRGLPKALPAILVRPVHARGRPVLVKARQSHGLARRSAPLRPAVAVAPSRPSRLRLASNRRR